MPDEEHFLVQPVFILINQFRIKIEDEPGNNGMHFGIRKTVQGPNVLVQVDFACWPTAGHLLGIFLVQGCEVFFYLHRSFGGRGLAYFLPIQFLGP